jgi:hypothetical protein
MSISQHLHVLIIISTCVYKIYDYMSCVCLRACVCVVPSVCLSVCLSVYLSFCLTVCVCVRAFVRNHMNLMMMHWTLL